MSSMAINKLLFCLFWIALFSFHFLHVHSNVIPRRSMLVDPKTVVAEFLRAHNVVRAKHKLPSLTWSKSLANYAKWYANKRRGDCALVHSSNNKFGENIFMGEGKRWKPTDAVVAWAAEESYYNYKDNKCESRKVCGHYTQLVWRSTKKVGCSQIICNGGGTFIVCEYYPPGNIIGVRPY